MVKMKMKISCSIGLKPNQWINTEAIRGEMKAKQMSIANACYVREDEEGTIGPIEQEEITERED